MVLIFEHVCADFFDQLRVLKNYYRFTNGFLGLLAIAGLEKLRREWLMRKIRTVDKDLFPNHWLIGGALDAPDPHVPGLNLKNKVGCVFPIVVVCCPTDPICNSDEMTIGKTHPTLAIRVLKRITF